MVGSLAQQVKQSTKVGPPYGIRCQIFISQLDFWLCSAFNALFTDIVVFFSEHCHRDQQRLEKRKTVRLQDVVITDIGAHTLSWLG